MHELKISCSYIIVKYPFDRVLLFGSRDQRPRGDLQLLSRGRGEGWRPQARLIRSLKAR